MDLYHTALSSGSITYDDIPETISTKHRLGIMLKNDIIADGLPSEFDLCDVLYAEPPWPHGFHVFNKRAGVSGPSYDDLAKAIENIILTKKKPTFILLGKTLLRKLPEAEVVLETILNGNSVIMAVWNASYSGPTTNTAEICKYLGSQYAIMGDFTCGYGSCIRNFLLGGGSRFVASDYDGKCITVMSAQMENY